MAKLATYVHLTDESGRTYVFGPHSEVPGWAAKRITNPKALQATEPEEDKPKASEVPRQRRSRKSDDDA